MKDKIILMLKGMIIGVANIIPGVSGGTLMITLGLYEEIISTISHFFKNWKKNLKFIIPLAIGMGLAILLLSKVIKLCLGKYPFPTTFFFFGLVLGGIPLLWNKAKASKKRISNWAVFILTFAIVLAFAFLKEGNFVVDLTTLTPTTYIMLLIVGIISAATMVVPGISGSLVLMLLGYYEPINNTISNLTNFSLLGHNLLILVPFGLGIVVGIVLIAKLIEYLLKRYPVKTYYGVLGFVMASLIAIIKPVFITTPGIIEVIIAVILLITGSLIAYKLGDK